MFFFFLWGFVLGVCGGCRYVIYVGGRFGWMVDGLRIGLVYDGCISRDFYISL